MDEQYYKGILKRWDDQRGFGFIGADEGDEDDVFFHISALSNPSPNPGQRPREGDVFHYQLQLGSDNKRRAINVRTGSQNPSRPAHRGASVAEGGEKRRWPVQLALFALVLAGIALWAYLARSSPPVATLVWTPAAASTATAEAQAQALIQARSTAVAPLSRNTRTSRFICNGKVYCSQMNSCAEAKFYLRNCPGTKMDGDGDGIPCETQWCGRY